MGPLKPLPRFPGVTRDLALVMDETVAVGPLMAAMRKAGGDLLESIEMFDVYRGGQLATRARNPSRSPLIFRARRPYPDRAGDRQGHGKNPALLRLPVRRDDPVGLT